MTTQHNKIGSKADSMDQSDPIHSQEKLNAALRDVFDLLEKLSGTQCLLLGETARTVYEGNLDVNRIQVGIRQLDLTPARKGTLYTHVAEYFRRGTSKTMSFEPESPPAGELKVSYDFNDIPIDILVITKDNPFFKNPSPITYNYDFYVLPNPLNGYLGI